MMKRGFRMHDLLFHPPHPPPPLCTSQLCGSQWRQGSECRVTAFLCVLVSDALILLKQSSVLAIYSIAWDIFCQTCNAERQAQCCLASGQRGKGLNALFSIDLCSALKINGVFSDPLNYWKPAAFWSNV